MLVPGVRIPPFPPSLRRSPATVGRRRAYAQRATASQGELRQSFVSASVARRHSFSDGTRTQSAKATKMFYVYILKCVNNRLYIGCTDDLKDRIRRHKNGLVPATRNLLPIKLIFVACFPNKYLAYKFEKYLKSGSGRAFLNKHLIYLEGCRSGRTGRS